MFSLIELNENIRVKNWVKSDANILKIILSVVKLDNLEYKGCTLKSML